MLKKKKLDFSGENFIFHELQNIIKSHQIFVWFQTSFLSPSRFKFHQILKIWLRISSSDNTVTEYFNAW